MALPYTFGTQSGSIPLNELDENFQYLEAFVPPLAVAAGTVTAPNQPNITAIGTVVTLSCTGTITTGTLAAGLINGTIQTPNQPNITQLGLLQDLDIVDTLNVSNVSATGIVVAPTVSGTTLSGTLSTPAQPAITSLGTLGSLSVTGTVQAGQLRSGGALSVTGTVTGGDATLNSLFTGTVNATDITELCWWLQATLPGPMSDLPAWYRPQEP